QGFNNPSRAVTAIRLSWTKNDYADGYIIEQYTNSGWVQIADVNDGDTTTYKVTGLKSGTAYKFRMKAYSVTETGAIVYSNNTVTLTANTNASSVSSFGVKSRSSIAIRLAWRQSTTVDGYIIEQMIDGVWTEIADITDNTITEYKVTGLSPSTEYQFRMKSYAITKYGDKTYSAYTETLTKSTNPSAVSELKVKSRSDRAIRLAWAEEASADGYLIEQYIDGQWVQIADVNDSSITEYKVTGLASATEYQFRVRAYNTEEDEKLCSLETIISGTTL
ncbi:MAG: fibronectin type III domain-containing protein, partial [Ruminiclostridium sp.]|nr:fibronectin type III domain-containing protein [Ruminiclostridium sp.]